MTQRTIITELTELQDHYHLNHRQMGEQLLLGSGHYSEVLSGKRRLPYRSACLAYNLGAEAAVLLSLVNFPETLLVRPPASALVRVRRRKTSRKEKQ